MGLSDFESNSSRTVRHFFIEELDIPAPWNLQLLFGSKSLFAIHEDYFIKILPRKPFVHDVLIKHSPFTNENAPLVDLYKFSPRLLAFKLLTPDDLLTIKKVQPRLSAFLKNVKTGYMYVFERRNFIKIQHLLQKNLLTLDKETVAKIMKSLIYTINLLHLEGFTYHDLCGDNLLWDIDIHQAFLIDLDSSIPAHLPYEEAKKYLIGQHTFHRVYHYLRKKKEHRAAFRDLSLFGSCLIYNFFLALIAATLTKQYDKINFYARELPKILLSDNEPTAKETRYLLQHPRIREIFRHSWHVLQDVLDNRQPSRINALLSLINLL